MTRLCLFALLVAACAPTLPAPYVHARDGAERAYSSGDYARAAELWLEAARTARPGRDHDEADYRAAASFERAEDLAHARALYQELARGHSERAPRASFDLAELEIKTGDAERGYAALEAAVHAYPSSGVAGTALNRYLSRVSEQGGPSAVLAYVAQAEPSLDKSERAEQLLYARARALDELTQSEQALAAYLAVAARFPYPYGAYWDDALFRGAADAELLGRPEQAISLLTRMLAERETSRLSGSYERPRYAEAAFHVAEIYRDRLHDAAAAKRAFARVFDDFPTSTLRDDALWNLALLAHAQGDGADSCASLARLVRELPDSRYAPCAKQLCPTLTAMPGRECHAYIERELSTDDPVAR
ncbi:MAG TPA: tetratricopeptide repeat protein [Polyangiaceae bacterium]|jgi:tetratricopeptide (TPR) repeat protein